MKRFLSALITLQLLFGLLLVPNSALLPTALAADPWYDDAWLYRRAITVTNPNASVLSNFQVEVNLSSANFSFAEAVPNGADLRVTDSTGTLLPHWIEAYDPIGETGKIWTKVSSLPASGSETLYLYYGNPLANQGSDGFSVFPFFDDFEDRDISDWTLNFVNLGTNSRINIFNGLVGLVVRHIDFGNMRRQYTGSFVGKTVEAHLQYGWPQTTLADATSTAIGESYHPKLTVFVANNTQIGVGGVQWSTGTMPINNLRRSINGATTPNVNTPIFSYGILTKVVNRISFPDAASAVTAMRVASSSTWEGTMTHAYTVANLDNAFVVLGKRPESTSPAGGTLAYNTWDWVRVREYAALEPTSSVGAQEAQKLLAKLQLDNSLPGALETQYTFTVTPNMPIPSGGALDITFPAAFTGRMDALTAGSIAVAAHGQITGTTPTINTGTRTLRLVFTASAPITDDIVITVGDGAGVQGDLIHPVTGGPHTITFASSNTVPETLATGELTMSTAGWWNTSWLYRKSVHVNNAKVSSTLPTYQVQVRLTSSNFDFTHAQAAGQDLRFVTPAGTELPHWIESYDNIGQTAVVWVKMTNIPGNTEQMIFLYHGNNAASTTSDGSTVFDFFDDFEDNDISDWTTYSRSLGAITVAGGNVKINELRDNRAYAQKSYNGAIDGKALEGVIRYVGSAIGEEFSPSLGYLVGAGNTALVVSARRYSFGTTPTDQISAYVNGTRYDIDGATNYNTGEDLVYSLNTKGNYFIVQTRRYANTTWDAYNTSYYNLSSLDGRDIHFGKRAWSTPGTDLNVGTLAEHQWKSIRLRDFVYFEPTTLLGSEEANNLPAAPTALFINTAAEGADTAAADPMQLTSKSLVVSAIYNAATTLEQATRYDYEVATDAGFTSIVSSATFQLLGAPLSNGQRSGDIALNAAALSYNTDYYVRVRFYDATGLISPSSAAVQFHIPDATGPTITALTPTNNATEVAVASNLTFTLDDAVSGVNTATLDVSIGGVDAIVNGVCQAGYACNFAPSGSQVAVTINPDANLATNTAFPVTIYIEDTEGNATSSNTTFSTIYVPTAPTSTFLNTAAAGASSNAGDLLNLTTKNLAFSAIFNDATAGDTATHYDYDIATDAGFATIVDSETNTALGAPVANGVRTESIAFTALDFNTDYYLRVRLYDVAGHLSPNATTVHFRVTDNTLPSLSLLSPADAATNVDNSTNITFRLSDTISSVDTGTLDVTVDGVSAIVNGVCQAGFSCSITPNGADYDVSINPGTDFTYSSVVPLVISVDDVAANNFSITTSFTVEDVPDTTAPALSTLTPADGATDVARNASISFSLTDDTAVLSNSINATVDGTAAITAGVCQAGFTCGINAAGSGFHVTILADTLFTNGTVVTVSITATDAAANPLTNNTSFTVIAAAATTTPPPTFTGGGGGSASTSPDTATVAPNDTGSDTTGSTGSTGTTDSGSSSGGDFNEIPSAFFTGAILPFFPMINGVQVSKPALPPLETTPAGQIILQSGSGGLRGSAPLEAGKTACEAMTTEYNYTIPEDVSDSLFEEIALLHKFGVNFSGTKPGALNLSKPVTRSEMLKYLLQLTCADYDRDISDSLRFPDVPTSHPDDLYIHLGRKYGLVTGYMHNGLYEPDKIINAAEALKISTENMLRGSLVIDGKAEIFPDLDYTLWYGRYIRFTTDRGLLHATDSFQPDAPIVLEEVIHLLVKAITLRPYK